MPSDPYSILGVDKSASQEDIKRAYRDIARKYHPDKNPGDAEAQRIFAAAAEAYRVLGDADLRAEHDRRAARLDNPSELFEEIFGARGEASARKSRSTPPRAEPIAPKRSKERGEDLRYTLELSFEQAAFGGSHTIEVPRRVRCEPCGGTGAKAGTMPRVCPTCQGSGMQQSTSGGVFQVTEPCRECRGRGLIVDNPCEVCHGSGRTQSRHTMQVRIPAGVTDGQKIRIKGKGSAGENGGSAGDLYVIVHVRPHPVFGRQGDNLTVTVPVTFAEAALGAEVEVPILGGGSVKLRIPAGTPNGRTFRIRGRGVTKSTGEKGDLLAAVDVQVPGHLPDEARSALQAYAEAAREPNPRNDLLASNR